MSLRVTNNRHVSYEDRVETRVFIKVVPDVICYCIIVTFVTIVVELFCAVEVLLEFGYSSFIDLNLTLLKEM